MTSKEQYCDYKLYLKHRHANAYYNDAIKYKNTAGSNWIQHCSTALHKSIILNQYNTDSLLLLDYLLKPNPVNPLLTNTLCKTYKQTALEELRKCYSATDLRKKY
jgi:hypothetical protein